MSNVLQVLEEFIAAYVSGDDPGPRVAQLEDMAARGATDELRSLWRAATEKRWGIFDRRRAKLSPLAGDVERALAGAGRADGLELLAELLAQDRTGRDADDLGVLANHFANGADEGALEALGKHADALPSIFFANAVQGAVLHGLSVGSVPSLVAAWRSGAREQRLSGLPLERRPIEAELVAGGASSAPIVRGSAGEGPLDVNSVTRRQEVLPAVRSWVSQSNGRTEWVEVTLATSIETIGPAQLISLGLESLADVGTSDLRMHAVTTEVVLGRLFSAALGGAYAKTRGLGDARRDAWSSVAQLCGMDAEAELNRVESAAKRTRWWSFDPVGAWFFGVAWDLGLVGLSDDGLRLAVLAATDTD